MSWLVFVKVTLVFATAWLALSFMRRASAALRHSVVLTALLAALLLPALEVALPAWQVLPRPAASPVHQDTGRAGDSLVANPVAAAAEAADPARSAIVATSTVDRGLLLPIVWLTGAATLLLLLLARIAAMEIDARRARPLQDPQWDRLLARAGEALRLHKPVRLKLRDSGTMPAVWGLREPVVLLPEDCRSWPQARRRDVLMHELAHIARRDVLVSILGHVACALHWFNPLAWALKHRLAVECEHACDDAALTQGAPASRYADHLLTTAAACRKHYSLAPVMAAQSQLESRIMAILDNTRNRGGASLRAQFVIVAIAAAAMVPLSSLAWTQAADMWAGPSHRHSDSSRFAEHLEKIGVKMSDTDALLNGLGASGALTRAASAWALGDSDEPRVIDPLIQAGYDSDAVVRQWAVRSLAAWDAPRIADMLVARLQDRDAEVRQWAVRTLERHDSGVSTQPLIDTLGDTDSEVREWAVRVLAAADDPRVPPALASRVTVETDAAVSEWLVRALGQGDNAQSTDALLGALSHDSSDVRQWAVRGLAGVRDERVVDALIATLGDNDDEVREWSARALGVCGNKRAIVPLRAMSRDPSSEVREWAGRALEQIDC